ncbi:hypothetical protein ACRRTK_002666 [Alexandromys fortis]
MKTFQCTSTWRQLDVCVHMSQSVGMTKVHRSSFYLRYSKLKDVYSRFYNNDCQT